MLGRGGCILDLNIFLFLVVLMFVFAFLGLFKNDVEWAVFPGLAIVMGLFFHTALLADGSLTQVSGGSTVAILSASTAVSSAWQAVQYVPATMTILSFLVVVFRVGSYLRK